MLHTCAFTGHRPASFDFKYDEKHPDCISLKQTMRSQVSMLIHNGVTHFISGMALGTDIWGAEMVLLLKKECPWLRLTAALPCETQANRWSVPQRERYFNILAQCDETVFIGRRYTANCMMKRNQWLVDNAAYILAVYNGKPSGGTASTIRYAQEKKRTVIILDPRTMKIVLSVASLQNPSAENR